MVSLRVCLYLSGISFFILFSFFLFIVFALVPVVFERVLELCRFPLIFSCPADHAPDWQPRILGRLLWGQKLELRLSQNLANLAKFQ